MNSQDDQNKEVLLTVEDVAQYLSLSPQTVRAKAKSGELPAVKMGRSWRFHRSDIQAVTAGGASIPEKSAVEISQEVDAKKKLNPPQNNKSHWKKIMAVVAGITAVVVLVNMLFEAPTKFLALKTSLHEILSTLTSTPIGTITPISLADEQYNLDFSTDGTIYSGLDELSAITKDGKLWVRPKEMGLLAVDGGYSTAKNFRLQVEVNLSSGGQSSFFCLAFSGESEKNGILTDHLFFCLDGKQHWMTGIHQQVDTWIYENKTSPAIKNGHDSNLIQVQANEGTYDFSVNGTLVYSLPGQTLSGSRIGYGVIISSDPDGLPVWTVTSYHCTSYKTTIPKITTEFAFLKVLRNPLPIETPGPETPAPAATSVVSYPRIRPLSISQPASISQKTSTIVMVDISGSMLKSDPELLGRSILDLLAAVAPPTDQLGIGVFSDDTRILMPLMPVEAIDRQTIFSVHELLLKPQPSIKTNFLQAVQAANEQFSKISSGDFKNRLIIITDSTINDDSNELGKYLNNSQHIDIDSLDVIMVANASELAPQIPGGTISDNSAVVVKLHLIHQRTDLPGLIIDLYAQPFGLSDERAVILPSERSYQVSFPENTEKVSLIFQSSNPPDFSSQEQLQIDLTGPSSANTFSSSVLITRDDLTILTLEKPSSGIWQISVRTKNREAISLNSLILVSK